MPLWGPLGSFLRAFGRILGLLGASWTPLGCLLDASWGLLEASWGIPGTSKRHKMSQDAPKMPREAPRTAQMDPQDAPKTHQEAPKTALQAPKTRPKPLQGSPNKDTQQQIRIPSEVGVVSAVGAAVDGVVDACKGQTTNSPAHTYVRILLMTRMETTKSTK